MVESRPNDAVSMKRFRNSGSNDVEMDKQSRSIRALATLLVVTSAALQSACSQQSDTGVTALCRAQTSTDELPACLDADGDLGVAPDSSRLFSEQTGVEYFAARSASGKEVCLIMFASLAPVIDVVRQSMRHARGSRRASDVPRVRHGRCRPKLGAGIRPRWPGAHSPAGSSGGRSRRNHQQRKCGRRTDRRKPTAPPARQEPPRRNRCASRRLRAW